MTHETLEEHFQRWRQLTQDSGRSDRPAAISAVNALYRTLLQRGEPTVIFCKSPFQLVMMPSLVVNILNSEPWYLLMGQFSDRQLTKEELEEAWEKTWIDVWNDLASPVLHQMLRNLRHAGEFVDLLPALRDSLSEQLLSRLKSGRFEFTELQMHKSAYRQAWLVQEWFANLAGKNLDQLTGTMRLELKQAEQANSLEGEDVYLNAVGDFAEYCGRVERALGNIIMRMGAEAVSQTSTAVWRTDLGPWLAPCELFQDTLSPEIQPQLQIWKDLFATVSGFIVLEDMCFVCERPTRLAITEFGQLHNSDGPALAYSDGFQIHAWDGVLVPSDIIDFPDTITCQSIDNEINAEVRRVMLERFGQARYIEESGAVRVHEDDFGTLYRKELQGDEPLVMVKVVNSSPEPDGTYKDYFLRVPPQISTAREAVAWTFDLKESDYAPDRQT